MKPARRAVNVAVEAARSHRVKTAIVLGEGRAWEDNRTKTRWQGIVFLSDAPDVTRGMQVSDALSVLA